MKILLALIVAIVIPGGLVVLAATLLKRGLHGDTACGSSIPAAADAFPAARPSA